MPTLTEWPGDTSQMIFFAYGLAGVQIYKHQQPVPREADVIPFCRAALDRCISVGLDPDVSPRLIGTGFRFDLGDFDPPRIPEERLRYRCVEMRYSYRPRVAESFVTRTGQASMPVTRVGAQWRLRSA